MEGGDVRARTTEALTVLSLQPEPLLLTIPEAARLLRVSRAQAYQLAARGDLPVVRIGRSVRVRADRLERWLDERSR